MLTPVEYSFLTPEMLGGEEPYRHICQHVGLPATPSGYGFLTCVNVETGQHWTCATEDIDYVQLLISANGTELSELEIPADKFPIRAIGWPDEWYGRSSWQRHE